MRSLRCSINITLDGCCDHRAGIANEAPHRFATESLARADALLFGRVIYEMMVAGWREPAPAGTRPDWTNDFARTINAAKKYVVSSTLKRVDWNAELVLGDLVAAVKQLKAAPGKELLLAGVTLPLALAEHGPTLFAGLSKYVDLKLVSRREFDSGAVVLQYEPVR
jgi:dihydrofolate reductase